MARTGDDGTGRGAPRGGRCTAYLATTLGAVIAALVLALASTPALAAPDAKPAAPAGVPAPDANGPAREASRLAPAAAVRRVRSNSADADALLAALRHLRHAPGQEALGIAYAAAYLRAAEAARIDAEPFDALGTMAERLAQRASAADARSGPALAAQVEAAAADGVRFVTLQHGGRAHLCYDGEAFRRVLALQPEPAQQARAMLALTRHDCVDPTLTPAARRAFDAWRADLLDLPWRRGYDALAPLTKNRLHLRRAGLWAARAHQLARLGRPAQAAAERALAELATVNPAGFTEPDRLEYAEAALRVGAVRWPALPPAAAAPGLGDVEIAGGLPASRAPGPFRP
jgi:hypothetical protein